MATNIINAASSNDTPLPSTPPNTPLPLNNDMPIKITSSTVLPFTTHSKYCVISYHTLGLEVKSFLVGPMPIDIFLNTCQLHRPVTSSMLLPKRSLKLAPISISIQLPELMKEKPMSPSYVVPTLCIYQIDKSTIQQHRSKQAANYQIPWSLL